MDSGCLPLGIEGGRHRSRSRSAGPFPHARRRPEVGKRTAQVELEAATDAAQANASKPASVVAREDHKCSRTQGETSLTSTQPSGGAKAPIPRSWATVAKAATKGYSLSFIPPVLIDNKLIVNLNEEVLEATDPKWFECIVGYFVGKRLPFKLIEDALKHLWGHHLVDIMANDQGFYFFHIPNQDFQRNILDGGPLTMAHVPLIV
ncbi:hypothetical protein BT93_L2184 [Corymbia citriodora subsp. variegata]|uniref:DUF4283 domain-containing protein n=1 Tax=Corymbia citriodora subsp. variegata TaxID=360336 RepID=A0A8T0CKD1_CORYI|nr:hypothetical protein BT93_L2184 [Corymbia citriodora subsp. variegata]